MQIRTTELVRDVRSRANLTTSPTSVEGLEPLVGLGHLSTLPHIPVQGQSQYYIESAIAFDHNISSPHPRPIPLPVDQSELNHAGAFRGWHDLKSVTTTPCPPIRSQMDLSILDSPYVTSRYADPHRISFLRHTSAATLTQVEAATQVFGIQLSNRKSSYNAGPVMRDSEEGVEVTDMAGVGSTMLGSGLTSNYVKIIPRGNCLGLYEDNNGTSMNRSTTPSHTGSFGLVRQCTISREYLGMNFCAEYNIGQCTSHVERLKDELRTVNGGMGL